MEILPHVLAVVVVDTKAGQDGSKTTERMSAVTALGKGSL